MSVTSPYVVPVSLLLKDVPSRRTIAFRAPFDAAHEFERRADADSDVPPDSDVNVAIVLESHHGGLVATGQVSAPWRALCRRCSTVISSELTVDVFERFECDPELQDDEAYLVEAGFVDLLPLVHDAILLELPVAPLCRADCQGLCPVCGIDRNEATCDCLVERDSRWATLDALRFENDES